jgi:hypothetical protein
MKKMKVKQIAEILNTINAEIIGESAVVAEDLSNIVDVGKEVIGAVDIENYTRSLIDRVGRVVFWDRTYNSTAPNILKDSWEFDSIMEKIRCELPDVEENPSWKLTKGQSYDPFIFNPPAVKAKFFNSKTTFEIPISFVEEQIKSAFTSASEMSRFFAMIENRVIMKMTLCTDSMIMRTINNLIAEKFAANNNVINLLAGYNTKMGTTLTAAKALSDKEFLRYACKQINLYSDYLTRASMLFNDKGYVTFTPKENQKIVMLSEFDKSAEVYLYSDTFHNSFVKLDGYTTVPYWQGSGTDDNFDFDEISKISVKTASGTDIEKTGIIGVIFDENACAVCNENPRTTSQYNAKGEFINYFHKWDCSYINDTNENCIVFVVEDTTGKP